MTTTTKQPEADHLRATLREAEEALGVTRDRIRVCEDAIGANGQKEVDVALGNASPEEVQAEREQLQAELDDAQKERRRLELVVGSLPARIEELATAERSLQDLRALGHAEDAYLFAAEHRDALADRFLETVEDALEASRRFGEARARADAAFNAYQRAASDAGAQDAEPVDEPEFRPSGVEQLTALLLEGPRTPAADSERAAARQDEKRRRSDAEATNSHARAVLGCGFIDMREQKLATVPEHLRPAVDARIRELTELHQADAENLKTSMRTRALEGMDANTRAQMEQQWAVEDATDAEEAEAPLVQLDGGFAEADTADAQEIAR